MHLNSIRIHVLLVLLLICVAIVLVIGGIWLYASGQDIKSNVVSSDLRNSELLGGYVKEYVEELESSMDLATHENETIEAVRNNNSTLARDVFQNLVNATPQDDTAYVMDRSGRLLYTTCSTASASGKDLPDAIDMSRNYSYVTSVFYSDERRDQVFAVVAPIRDGDTTIGYAYDEIRPADLCEFILKEKRGLVHHVMLADQKGRAIVLDNGSGVARHDDLSSYLPVKRALNGEHGTIEHAGLDDGKAYVSAYYPIPNAGWGLVVSTRSDLAYKPLEDHALQIAGAGLLFIIALGIFGYFASMHIIAPVERLSRTMRRVSAGDYDAGIEAARDDEIGDLERAFNTLVLEIKKRSERIGMEKGRAEFYLDLMSHDINNMNHAGMGYLETAIDGLKGRIDPGSLSMLEKAYDSLASGSLLIGNMRKIRKMQTSQLKQRNINICPILAEIQAEYAQVPGRSVTINYTPSGTGCIIMTNELFREAIANIVSNAIKHSDPGRPLTVDMALDRVREEGRDYCRVSIEDNGPGIPDETKKTLFSRFQQGRIDARGRGLGLYIVKTLVEESGGKVWAEDRVPGDHTRGARFVIIIPEAT